MHFPRSLRPAAVRRTRISVPSMVPVCPLAPRKSMTSARVRSRRPAVMVQPRSPSRDRTSPIARVIEERSRQRVKVPPGAGAEVALAGLPLGGVLLKPHRAGPTARRTTGGDRCAVLQAVTGLPPERVDLGCPGVDSGYGPPPTRSCGGDLIDSDGSPSLIPAPGRARSPRPRRAAPAAPASATPVREPSPRAGAQAPAVSPPRPNAGPTSASTDCGTIRPGSRRSSRICPRAATSTTTSRVRSPPNT